MKRLPRAAWCYLALIACVFAAYSNVWSFAYLYDDEFLFQKNLFITSFEYFFDIFQSSSTGGAGFKDSFYRPLQIVSYLFTAELFGKEPWAFHLLNNSLHAVNACLVFLLAMRLGVSQVFAFAIAALWAVQPVHTEAIAYKSGTADPLSTVFILIGTVLLAREADWKRLFVSLICFALALSSKEAAIVFPGLVMTILFLTRDERWKIRTYRTSIPFWCVAFLYLGLRATVLNFNSDFTMYKFESEYAQSFFLRLYTFLSTVPDYLVLLIAPHDLHIDRDYPVASSLLGAKTLLGLALIAIPTAAFVIAFKRKSKTWLAWGALWFFAAYGPSSGLLIPVNAIFLEHWLYLPSIGLFIAFGWWLDTTFISKKSRTMAITASLVVAGVFAALTFRQNFVWKSPISLYSHILKYNPAAGRVRHNLAMAYDEAGRTDEAIREYEFVLAHGGNFPQTHHNLGQIHFRKGNLDLAEKHEFEALKLAPGFHPSYAGLSKIYEARGDIKKAQEFYSKALELLK